MKTFNIQISEEQLRLIRAMGIFTLNHNGSLTENEREEIDMIVDMVLDVVEEGDEETTHGFCY